MLHLNDQSVQDTLLGTATQTETGSLPSRDYHEARLRYNINAGEAWLIKPRGNNAWDK